MKMKEWKITEVEGKGMVWLKDLRTPWESWGQGLENWYMYDSKGKTS
jgi:hypothetical protein